MPRQFRIESRAEGPVANANWFVVCQPVIERSVEEHARANRHHYDGYYSETASLYKVS